MKTLQSELVRPRAGYSAMKPGGRNWSGHETATCSGSTTMKPGRRAKSERLESGSVTWDVGKVGGR